MSKRTVITVDDNTNKRLDKFISDIKENISRSYIQKLINDGNVKVNDSSQKCSYKLKTGDKIIINIPEPEKIDLKEQSLPLNILYEDSHIIVINKQAGRLVHPTPHQKKDTVVNALLAHCDDLAGIAGKKRPGIVHRLDKNTSGVLIAAKTDKSHQYLTEQFKNRKTKKFYRALSTGKIPHKRGKIEAPIGRDPNNRTKMTVTEKNSKYALTYFKVLDTFAGYSYLKLRIKTGRTHQVRVHLSYMGYPLCGDKKYGNDKIDGPCNRPMLHAYRLGFKHPDSKKWLEFTAPLPQDFSNILSDLKTNP
ncbi:MAG: RluA family pseudouridine synthase [Bacillota bacterium]